jgi:CO/xanthine dehydrogenase Mo-binding subunit
MSLPELNIVGKAENHDQSAMQVIVGKQDFASDRLPNRKYYGAIRGSNFTRGKVTNVDGSEALKIAGVKAVVSAVEVPDWRDDVVYWGQPVAGVVAIDPYIAEYALTKVKVEYTPGEAVVDPDEAMKADAPLSGIRADTNVGNQTDLARGDVAAALAAAEVVEDATFGWTTIHQHNTLEPHNVVAWWIGDDYYFWTGSQHIHSAKNTAVNTLGMAGNKVHAFTHFTGGGHGDKTGAPLAAVGAIMSKAVNGYPVQIRESRKFNVTSNTRQFQVRSAIKIGAKKDGTFTALDATWWSMGGANANTPSGNVHFGVRTTYTIPDAQFTVNIINTNSPQRVTGAALTTRPATSTPTRPLTSWPSAWALTPTTCASRTCARLMRLTRMPPDAYGATAVPA